MATGERSENKSDNPKANAVKSGKYFTAIPYIGTSYKAIRINHVRNAYAEEHNQNDGSDGNLP